MTANPMDFINNNISIIPCKTIFDEKKNIFSGKFPAIREWSQYCTEIPDEAEAMRWGHIKGVSGFGIVTGTASNIACIDIDTTDKDLIKKILAIIPYTPCVIKGNRENGGKHLFRLYDSIHEYQPQQVLKQKVKDINKETIVDIFYGNSYLVAPPSLHSKDKDGNNVVNYEWEGMDLLEIGVDNLPILDDPTILEKIDMAVRGMTSAEIAQNLPTGAIDLSGVGVAARSQDGHRYDDMVSFVAGLIAKKLDPTTAVRELLQRDDLRNGDNPYFLDPTKGSRFASRDLNAMRFYFGNLEQKNRNKPSADLEIPQLSKETIFTPSSEWGEIQQKYKPNPLPEFDMKWIPNDDIRKFIQDGSRANSVAPQCLFFYMLGGLSSVVGNKLKIQPYLKNVNYVETFNLYIGNVASSGERKSETTSLALSPLKSLDKKIKEKVRAENKKNTQAIQDIETKIKSLHSKRKKEIEDGEFDSVFAKELMDEIDALEEKKPKRKNVSLYEQMATPQKMYEIAEENPTGIYVEFNEFGTKWKELQARGSEAEKAFFLDGWDGRRAFSYKTKHHGENNIDELCLSVGFSAQFDVMEEIISELMNNKGLNDGLLQRFLIFCSDSKKMVANDTSFVIPNKVHEIFENAYYIAKTDVHICFQQEAYALWMDFLNNTQRKKDEESNPAIISAISKYDGLVLRLCGNIELIKSNGNAPTSISAETFKTAWEMIEYAEQHLRYLFDLQKAKDFDEILNLFKTSIIEDETTIRDLYRHNQRVFGKSSTEAKNVLREFADRNIIKIIKDGRTYKVKINPALFT